MFDKTTMRMQQFVAMAFDHYTWTIVGNVASKLLRSVFILLCTPVIQSAASCRAISRGILSFFISSFLRRVQFPFVSLGRYLIVLVPRGTSSGTSGTIGYNQLHMPLVLYLATLTFAEIAVSVIDYRLGLFIHALVLNLLLLHGALTQKRSSRALLWGLTLAPLIRILSLSLPLVGIPQMYWYAIISVPLFIGIAVAAHQLGYTRIDLGLTWNIRLLLSDFLLLIAGLILGIGEYIILKPQPLIQSLSLQQIWLPALILAVSTGFLEELLFRGLLQRAAKDVLGLKPGLLYISILFMIMHIGYLSLADLGFVFTVGLCFAVVTHRTGSVLGVSLAHAGVNISLFLIIPFILPHVLSIG